MFYKNQNNIKTGKDGEQLAATYLQNNGYKGEIIDVLNKEDFK